MSDLTPVPLDEIEAAAREATDGPWHQMAAAAWSGTNESPDLVADCPLYADAIHIATADPLTVSALCEALRIAVGVLVWATENYTPTHDERLRDRNDGCWCVSCESRRTLARVRELVDLGEKP